MTVSPALRRLLRIRELEEEQSRVALESALGELSGLQNALAAADGRDRQGRQMVAASAETGELSDRVAGVEESRAAMRLGALLEERKDAVEQEVELLRQSFLVRRVERRQAETLIDATEALDAIDAERRGQQALDEWHRKRPSQTGSEAKPSPDSGRPFPSSPRPFRETEDGPAEA